MTALEPSVMSFGTWAIGGWGWGGTDDRAAIRAIQAAHEAGVTAIDTAPAYGCGHAEKIVGEAVRSYRRETIIMTKAGIRWDEERGRKISTPLIAPSGRKVPLYRNCRPDSLRFEVHASLKRLGVECIDLLQIHWPDSDTPMAETMEALLNLRQEGKIREIGVCNFPVSLAREAQRALGNAPLASVQTHYSLLRHEAASDLLGWAIDEQVGFLAYSPLEHGLLTGCVREDRHFDPSDHRSTNPSFSAANRIKVNRLLDEIVTPVAAKHGATPAQVALAWTMSQRGVTSALVGVRNPDQAREDPESAGVKLSAEEIAVISRGFEGASLQRGTSRRGGRVWNALCDMVRGG
jgi:aryl-alcohol dehydrogenase-like predicted oxidoreductase